MNQDETQDLQSFVLINPADLQQEMLDFPGRLSHVGALYADSIEDAALSKERLGDVEAEVYLELKENKGKGDTEATIAARVRTDVRVKVARTMYLQARARESRYKHKVIEPMYTKRDMMINVGAYRRSEMDGDPLVRRAKREQVARMEQQEFNED